jgi:predicted acyltransferase
MTDTTSNTPTKSQRILSIDILRGITIAGMILVNNPGGPEEDSFTPLTHAEWIGLTPTDLVFPTFMFIMGITTYLSLRKFNFTWSKSCARKVAKRAFLLWGIGLAIALLLTMIRGAVHPDEWHGFGDMFAHLRILGVLPRLGICYGLAAVVALSVKHKLIPWLIAILFVGYYIILEFGNGYVHDSSNILAIVDNIVLGADHTYKWDTPDPEGLLSTLPALGHVLIGFCVGKAIMNLKDLNDKIERLFVIGAILTLTGVLLAYACPISKKLWTPTFALTTCGIGSTLLALMTWIIDKHHRTGRITEFFHVFGVNPLALYVLSDLILIPYSIIPFFSKQTLQQVLFKDVFSTFLPLPWASLLWACICVMTCWLVGLWLYKKKIYIKL